MCFRPPEVKKPKKCPVCGALSPFTVNACRKCGTPLPDPEPEKIKCPRCGAKNPITAKVCSSCGLTVQETTELLSN